MGDASGADRWTEERTTFQRVYDVLVDAASFLSAEEFAQRAHCSTGGARSALEQLREMGIAEYREGRPATYRRNDSYLRWKRIEQLARDHTRDELERQLDERLGADEAFQETFGVPEPAAVTASDVAVDREAIDARREDLDEWRRVRREIRLRIEAVERAERDRVGVQGRDDTT